MARTWEPITRVDVQVKGVDPADSGLLVLEVTLSADPPGEWPHRFENPVGVDVPISMLPAKIDRSIVRFRAPDGQLEEYVHKVDERIAAANDYYAGEVLPARHAAQQRLQDEADARSLRVGDAQRRADAL